MNSDVCAKWIRIVADSNCEHEDGERITYMKEILSSKSGSFLYLEMFRLENGIYLIYQLKNDDPLILQMLPKMLKMLGTESQTALDLDWKHMHKLGHDHHPGEGKNKSVPLTAPKKEKILPREESSLYSRNRNKEDENVLIHGTEENGSLFKACVPQCRKPLTDNEKRIIKMKQSLFELEESLSKVGHETKHRLLTEIENMEIDEASAHVAKERQKMKELTDLDENENFMTKAERICHYKDAQFSEQISLTEFHQDEKAWKSVLFTKLETNYNGFLHAFKVAHDLMNAGILSNVSRDLNVKSEKDLMIFRVKEVCNDIIRPYILPTYSKMNIPANAGGSNHFITTEEFTEQVEALRDFLGNGEKYKCYVCKKDTNQPFFFFPEEKKWHPIRDKKFDAKALGQTQFIVCGNVCEDFFTAYSIPKLSKQYSNPSKGKESGFPFAEEQIPKLDRFFNSLDQLMNVPPDVLARRDQKGLSLSEIEQLKKIEESEDLQELKSMMRANK